MTEAALMKIQAHVIAVSVMIRLIAISLIAFIFDH